MALNRAFGPKDEAHQVHRDLLDHHQGAAKMGVHLARSADALAALDADHSDVPNAVLFRESGRDYLQWAWEDEAAPVAVLGLWLQPQVERRQVVVFPAHPAAGDEKFLAAHPEVGAQ
jgi:hypothetical protein